MYGMVHSMIGIMYALNVLSYHTRTVSTTAVSIFRTLQSLYQDLRQALKSARANMTLCKYVAGDENSVYFEELVILLTSCGLLSPLVDSSLIWNTSKQLHDAYRPPPFCFV